MKVVFIILAVVVVLVIIGAMSSPPAGPQHEEKILGQDRMEVFDLDPAKKVMYYLAGVSSDAGVNTEKLYLHKFDMTTKQKTDIDMNIPYSLATLTWLSITKSGTVLVLDDGENPNNLSWKEANKPMLLEYNDTGKIASYEIMNPVIEVQEKKNIDCANIAATLATATNRQFAGIKKVNNTFIPVMAIIETVEGTKQAYYLPNCNPESLAQFKNEFFEKNISVLNQSVFVDTAAAPDMLWADTKNNFTFKSEKKKFTTLETGCEKYYGLVEWNGKKINMGSCIHGLLGVANSGHIFYEGNPIYMKKDGVYMLTAKEIQ